MELFQLETGTVPAESCNEEIMPILKRSTQSKNDRPSKAFLVNESLSCITNPTVTFAGPRAQSKDSQITPTSPVKVGDSYANPPKSPEYRQLSPKSLEGPMYRQTKNYQSAKASELLLQKRNTDQGELKKSGTILAMVTSKRDQRANSGSSLSDNSAPGSGKKKTLGELAEEWNSNQSCGESKKLSKAKNNSEVPVNDEDLVRHSAYYSTSSSEHGMSSYECRLRDKLKARRHLNRDEVSQERRNSNSPPPVKLHTVTT